MHADIKGATLAVTISLYFLHSKFELRSRGTGVGYKIPSAEVLDRIDPPRTPPALDYRWYLSGLLQQLDFHSAD